MSDGWRGFRVHTLLLDCGKNSPAIARDMWVWRNVCVFCAVGAAEHTAIALIPEEAVEGSAGDCAVPVSDAVSSLLANDLPDVGTHVPTT